MPARPRARALAALQVARVGPAARVQGAGAAGARPVAPHLNRRAAGARPPPPVCAGAGVRGPGGWYVFLPRRLSCTADVSSGHASAVHHHTRTVAPRCQQPRIPLPRTLDPTGRAQHLGRRRRRLGGGRGRRCRCRPAGRGGRRFRHRHRHRCCGAFRGQRAGAATGRRTRLGPAAREPLPGRGTRAASAATPRRGRGRACFLQLLFLWGIAARAGRAAEAGGCRGGGRIGVAPDGRPGPHAAAAVPVQAGVAAAGSPRPGTCTPTRLPRACLPQAGGQTGLHCCCYLRRGGHCTVRCLPQLQLALVRLRALCLLLNSLGSASRS